MDYELIIQQARIEVNTNIVLKEEYTKLLTKARLV